jgi:hypothetical protein
MLHAAADKAKGVDIGVSASMSGEVKSTRRSDAVPGEGIAAEAGLADRALTLRRTPRYSIIVVLPEDHVVSPDRLERIREGIDQDVDVLIACAGQPANLNALQRSVRDAQFLLAPAGTSIEALRELAIKQAAGDIVRLVSGARADDSEGTETELSMTS